MTTLTQKTLVADSFLIRGDQAGQPITLALLGEHLGVLAAQLPPGTRDLDLSTLKVSVENGELVLMSVSTHERPVR